jgi:2-dehydropantoate 2-reductase
MKVAVMGAGAVGCYYGAKLARAGHDVILIGRPLHVAAVRERGLLLESGGVTAAVRVAATEDSSGVADAEIVLFCVKSGDTSATGRAIAPYLKSGVVVLSLQNGVDSAERLQAALQRPVVPTGVYVAVDMPAAGHVRHHGRGELVIGANPSSEDIAGMFRAAGVPTEVSQDVISVLWTKLVVNCTYNALSAIPQFPYGRLMAVDGVRDVMTEVVVECIAVAESLGVTVSREILHTVLGLAASMPDQLSSTAQDLARGKKTEIDDLNGYVVRKGAELGIPTPANLSLFTMVKLMEAKTASAAPP